MRRALPTPYKSIFVRSILVGLCVAGATALCYPALLAEMGQFLVLSQGPSPADLILVLGGDFWGPRALKGAELGQRGYAPIVMISGPPYFKRPESELSIRFLVERGYPSDLFVSFPHVATSTIEEAIAVCPELHRRNARKVLIVTSGYHSRRANTVFRLFCPGIKFASTVPADNEFRIGDWWNHPHDRHVFFSEWKKLVATVVWKYPEDALNRLLRALRNHQGA